MKEVEPQQCINYIVCDGEDGEIVVEPTHARPSSILQAYQRRCLGQPFGRPDCQSHLLRHATFDVTALEEVYKFPEGVQSLQFRCLEDEGIP